MFNQNINISRNLWNSLKFPNIKISRNLWNSQNSRTENLGFCGIGRESQPIPQNLGFSGIGWESGANLFSSKQLKSLMPGFLVVLQRPKHFFASQRPTIKPFLWGENPLEPKSSNMSPMIRWSDIAVMMSWCHHVRQFWLLSFVKSVWLLAHQLTRFLLQLVMGAGF